METKTSGLLRGKVRIGVTTDGKPIDKYVSARTEAELENVKQACREHYILGCLIPDQKALHQYAEEWYTIRKEPFSSESSRASYKSCFVKHILPEFGLRRMRAISAADLQTFVNRFAGSSKSLITMVIGILRGVFSSAYAEGVIERDPAAALIRPKASKKEERRALTEEETAHVLQVIETHPEGLFLAVLYYLGLRRGEALGLKWGDFDFEGDQVHIQRDIDYAGGRAAHEGALKTAAADRFVPVPPPLKELLISQKGEAGADDYVFRTEKGQPLSQATYKRMWHRLMVAAGCVEWRRGADTECDILKQVKCTLTPHFFRHNYVTMLYESGVDPVVAMKIVGHSDYQTTANIYTHIRDEMLRKATVDLEDVFRKRAGEE